MASHEKRVDIRFGAFACTVQGFDDPMVPLAQVLREVGQTLGGLPALGEAGPLFDAETMRRLEAQIAGAGGGGITAIPGLVLTRSDLPAEDEADQSGLGRLGGLAEAAGAWDDEGGAPPHADPADGDEPRPEQESDTNRAAAVLAGSDADALDQPDAASDDGPDPAVLEADADEEAESGEAGLSDAQDRDQPDAVADSGPDPVVVEEPVSEDEAPSAEVNFRGDDETGGGEAPVEPELPSSEPVEDDAVWPAERTASTSEEPETPVEHADELGARLRSVAAETHEPEQAGPQDSDEAPATPAPATPANIFDAPDADAPDETEDAAEDAATTPLNIFSDDAATGFAPAGGTLSADSETADEPDADRDAPMPEASPEAAAAPLWAPEEPDDSDGPTADGAEPDAEAASDAAAPNGPEPVPEPEATAEPEAVDPGNLFSAAEDQDEGQDRSEDEDAPLNLFGNDGTDPDGSGDTADGVVDDLAEMAEMAAGPDEAGDADDPIDLSSATEDTPRDVDDPAAWQDDAAADSPVDDVEAPATGPEEAAEPEADQPANLFSAAEDGDEDEPLNLFADDQVDPEGNGGTAQDAAADRDFEHRPADGDPIPDNVTPLSAGFRNLDRYSQNPASDEEDDLDGPEVPTNLTAVDVAKATRARAVPDYIGASAAWLALVRGHHTFTRREVLDVFDGIPGDHPKTLEAKIKGFGRLVRNGQIREAEDNRFSLSHAERDRYEDLIT